MKSRRPYTTVAQALGGDPNDRVEVPCADCAEIVTVARFAYNLGKQANLGDHEITYCPSCKERRDAEAQEKRNRTNRRVCALIQAVKAGRAATDLELHWLETHGYSDAADAIRRVMRGRGRWLERDEQ